jgi:hypothetical protein
MSVAGVPLDARTLRAYAPLVVLVVTVAAGWMMFVRPIAAEQSRASGQLDTLRHREMALRGEVGPAAGPWEDGQPSPRGSDTDPVHAFERQVASQDAAPALLEHLARLASNARARNLLIETVESGAASAAGSAKAGRDDASQRDPRFALFDVPVSHAAIRVAFDTDYASLGRFLWAFRNLPTTVEIRALTVGLPTAESGSEDSARADVLRASFTLHAYSRTAPAVVVHASNSVTR